jgi:ribosome-associated translation inhibitor RaiA
MLELFAMNNTATLESNALKEKLLDVLKNNNLRPVIKEIEFHMYIYGADNHLSKFKNKGEVLVDKIKQLIGERITDLMMYSITEWAAAYVIAHEPQKIEELAKIYQINITKHEHNYQLYNAIRKMMNELDNLIYNLTEQIRKSRNENIYYGIVETIEKASSVKEYLKEVMDKIEKENKEIFENVAAAKRELNEIIHRILENL